MPSAVPCWTGAIQSKRTKGRTTMTLKKTEKPIGMQVLHLLTVVMLLGVTGCAATTIDARIQQRQVLFDSYDESTQARLQRGQIRIGDDADAVWFVYGNPTQKIRRTDANGQTEIWIYKILGYCDRLNHGVRPVYYDVGGRVRGSYYIDDTPEYEWKEVLRIEFSQGHVSAVQFNE